MPENSGRLASPRKEETTENSKNMDRREGEDGKDRDKWRRLGQCRLTM